MVSNTAAREVVEWSSETMAEQAAVWEPTASAQAERKKKTIFQAAALQVLTGDERPKSVDEVAAVEEEAPSCAFETFECSRSVRGYHEERRTTASTDSVGVTAFALVIIPAAHLLEYFQ